MKKLFSSFMLIIGAGLMLCGCAASASGKVQTADEQITVTPEPVMKKTIFISAVVDNRKFQKESEDRSVPVIDPEEKDRARVIGLKRNTLGMAIGTIYLHENKSVTGITQQDVIKALKTSGYKIIDKKDNISSDTVIVDVEVTKFWAWHKPGLWDIDINAQIENVITIKNNGKEDKITVRGSGKTKKNIGTEEAYHDAIDLAREELLRDLKKKLK